MMIDKLVGGRDHLNTTDFLMNAHSFSKKLLTNKTVIFNNIKPDKLFEQYQIQQMEAKIRRK